MENSLLILLLLLPVLFAAIVAFLPGASARPAALAGAGLTFLASLLLFAGYDPAGNVYRFVVDAPWFPTLGIRFHLGVDGPSMLLVVLTTFLSLMSIWYSAGQTREREAGYYASLLALEAALIGAFSALDLILFYAFFEISLVPAALLIGIWGGAGRIRAAMKFFVYTAVGSLFMLAAILAVFLYARGVPLAPGQNAPGFDLLAIRNSLMAAPLHPTVALWMFAAFALAFAIKTGLFPFHTWLPDTYAEAPAPVTAILSGAMAKLGTYGLYRFCLTLFPGASREAAPILVTLAVISILYAALVAAMQRDAKRVIAYSSVSHLGFVVMGLFAFTPQALTGSVLQMVNHGVSSGALFLLLGMIAARRGTTNIRALGGLWEQMPLLGRIFLIVTLSSIALPLTNGFVGEFLILLGTFQTLPVAASIATIGVIFSAVYMLWMFQRVMYGPVDKPQNRRLTDLSRGEQFILVPFVALIFLLGILPTLFSRKIDNSVSVTLSNTPPAPTPAVARTEGSPLAQVSEK